MSADPSASPCFFFAYTGQCGSGDQCTFSHAVEGDQPEPTLSDIDPNPDDASIAVPSGPRKEGNKPSLMRRTCIFWKKGEASSRRNLRQSAASSSNSRASSAYSITEETIAPPQSTNDGPHNEDDEVGSTRSELQSDQVYDGPNQEGGDRRLNALPDTEPTISVESTMRLFEPEDVEQVQEVQAQDQTALAIDHRAEDNTQQLAIDRPEEQGDIIVPKNSNNFAIDHPEEKGDTNLDDQTALIIDHRAEELEGNTQQDPEEKGDTSLDTISPDDYAPEAQDEHQEGQLDPMSDFVTDSMERDYTEAAEDNQAVGESDPNEYSEIPALHWTEYADPHADPFLAFCKFFAKGRCKKGASCAYRHALTVQEFFLLFRLEPFMWSPQVPVPEENIEEVALVQPPLATASSTVHSTTSSNINVLRCMCILPARKVSQRGEMPIRSYNSPQKLTGHLEFGSNEQGTDGWDEWNGKDSEDSNDRNVKRPPCRYFVNYGSCRKGDDCEFSHEKDDSHFGDKGSQAWNQDGSAASGSKGTEEHASASDWYVPDGDEKNESHGWDDTGGQGSTDKWDENESGKDNDRWGTGKEWDGLGADNAEPTAEGNNETSRKGNRQSSSRSGCRFSHETDDDTAHHDWNNDDWVTRNPLPETSSKQEWNSENETKDEATGGDECDAPSITSRQRDGSDQRTCWAYLRGQCHRIRCKFAHEPAADQQDGDKWSSDWNTDEQVNTWNSSQNADSWNEQPSEPNAEPWHRTDHASSYTSPGRGQETCLYFGQGFCPKGDSCPLLHVNSDDIMSSDNQEDVEEPAIEGKESAFDENMTTERFMYNCTVVFGAGGHVQYALTATDPNRVILKNLPSHVSRRELENLPVTGLRTVHVDKLTEPIKAIIELSTKEQTLSALQILNDYELEGSTLSAQLYSDLALDPDRAVMNCDVKVTWPTPCKTAWARYGTVTLAKEDAARLDGRIIEGRKIKASYLPAKKGQTTMFTVQIDNLPAEDTSVSIKQRCTECQYVNVTAPTYVSLPIESIKEILGKYGVLTAFDILDLPASEEMTAFAKFETPEAATAATGKVKVDFLGIGGILKVRGIHRSRFDIQPEQFRFIEGDLEKFRDIYNGQCSILVVSSDCDVRIYVAAAWAEAMAFSKLLASLDTLINGDILKQDEAIVWDDYFDSPSSTKVIDAVNAENSKDYNVLIIPDHRARRIHIFGEQLNRPRARESILKVLKKGQERLQSEADVGKNKVTLDLVDSKLIVKGDSKVLNKVKEIISNAVTIRRDDLDNASTNICYICLGKSISPITLQCRHGYCKECLSTLLASAVENIHTPLKCIAEIEAGSRCNQDIPYAVIRDLLPLADEERLLRAHFLSYVLTNMEGLFFCPSLHCEAVHRCSDVGTILLCPTCMMEICSSCQTRYHAGVTCDQWREIMSA
ncbi:hypothetical protein F5887DRAFT_915436 [Amanita rubescens]|nr:hypothetical protein F5887DRAFT_915436 [Amanita rubescens]